MRHILAKELGKKGVEVYLDDIHFHVEAKVEHDALLDAVLGGLKNNGFHLKAP